MISSLPKPKVVVVCGPTCAGKTSVAISLAEAFGGRIVSADSVQIYRYLDIGTAKPTPDEQRRVKHYMIDIVDPDEIFNAGRYAGMAARVLAALEGRNINPFVVGGTGLYIKALVNGIFQAKSADNTVRERLRAEAAACGTQVLHERLGRCDPEAARRIHPNDTIRIIRALEVYTVTGTPLSEYHRRHRFGDTPFEVLKIGIDIDRDVLYRRIDRRVDAMAAAGLPDEVRSLLDRGYDLRCQSMQSIGYRHMIDYLEKRVSWEDALVTMKRDTRRYAKRQMTWFGRDDQIHWIPAEKLPEMRRMIARFLQGEITA